jgi:transposase, IS30 family
MAYTHLTEDERYHIYELHVEKHGVRSIAEHLGRDKSTISRELRRNRGERGYRPGQAARLSRERAAVSAANGRRIAEAVWAAAEVKLREDWSPEQIAGRLRRDGMGEISHEAIYQRVYADKAAGGTLYRHLRCRKQRRKRYGGGRCRRGQIPNRVGIEHRPAVVERKSRIGDWEGDTIIGKGQQQAVVSLVERKSKYTLLHKVEHKTQELVSDGIVAQMQPMHALVHTITFDNGSEFAGHAKVSERLETDVYFARPYHSWERGLNENTNGLVRQYLPKKTCFRGVEQAQLDDVARKLNHRPRKTLDYRTPYEVMILSARKHNVALRV